LIYLLNLSDKLSVDLSDNLSDKVSVDLSDNLSDKVSVDLSDKVSVDLSVKSMIPGISWNIFWEWKSKKQRSLSTKVINYR